MSASFTYKLNKLLKISIISVILVGCATSAPVQEMSNARQTIASAVESRAEIYSPKNLEEAEKLMDQATAALESGDYLLAKEYAVSAQQYAIKARQQSISRQK